MHQYFEELLFSAPSENAQRVAAFPSVGVVDGDDSVLHVAAEQRRPAAELCLRAADGTVRSRQAFPQKITSAVTRKDGQASGCRKFWKGES